MGGRQVKWQALLLQSGKGHGIKIYATAMLLAVLMLMGAWLIWPGHIKDWDERLTSLSWGMADSGRVERRVVIVDIDENSVQALGPWPWPRERVAQLLTRLDDYQAGLRTIDILFDGEQPADPALAQALAAGAPAVIAQVLPLESRQTVHTGVLSGAIEGIPCPSGGFSGVGHMAPPATLVRAAGQVGHITPVVDADGGIRRVPALICVEGQAYPALPLAALATGMGEPVRFEPTQGWGASAGQISIGALHIPVDAQGALRVSYQQPRTGFVSISAWDVMRGTAPAELLKGSWVVIGATAFGAGDAVTTPQGGVVSGVEIHAQILAAALDGRTPYAPNWAPYWPWLWGLLAALLMAAILWAQRLRAGYALPLAAATIIATLWGTHLWLLLEHHLWLNWGSPALFVVLLAVTLVTAEWVRVRLEREQVFANLSRYLPEAAAQKVAYAEPSEHVQAERKEATVMCIDLRNFSAYCEGRSPEQAATVLHLFYTAVEKLVRTHGGVVEQMVGDSVIAVWNGSQPCPEHPSQALHAAEPIWHQVTALLPQDAPRAPLDVGIGIERGTVLVGSFGPARRRVHTVMGETVSVAVRLQAITAELGHPVLLGPVLAASQSRKDLQNLGGFLLDGMQTVRTLYALRLKVPDKHLRLVDVKVA